MFGLTFEEGKVYKIDSRYEVVRRWNRVIVIDNFLHINWVDGTKQRWGEQIKWL